MAFVALFSIKGFSATIITSSVAIDSEGRLKLTSSVSPSILIFWIVI
jgi:hypothetical protein